jgi:hypothetical protein
MFLLMQALYLHECGVMNIALLIALESWKAMINKKLKTLLLFIESLIEKSQYNEKYIKLLGSFLSPQFACLFFPF